jgi:GR25 family glycosyltransferase involved in LPS biosynthesis
MEHMKAYVIHLPSRPHSVAGATGMVTQLKSYGFDATLFEGTDGNIVDEIFKKEERIMHPYSIKSKKLNRDEIAVLLKTELPSLFWEDFDVEVRQRMRWNDNEIAKISNPGVKGCFHSHYRLWRLCVDLNEPIAIFEDDVKFYRGYIPVKFENVLILSLGKSSFLNEPFKSYLENPTEPPMAVPWNNYSMPGASGYAITPTAAKKLVKFYRNYYTPADSGMNKSIIEMDIHTHIMGRNTLKEEGNISLTKSNDWNLNDSTDSIG